MTILKSQSGKSRIIDILASNSDSIVYVYDNLMSIENSIVADPDSVSVTELANEIENRMIEENKNENHYDYLIIYTNCTEDEALNLYNSMRDTENFPVRDIIITCKQQLKGIFNMNTTKEHKCPNCGNEMLFIKPDGEISNYFWCKYCGYEEDEDV